MDLLHDEPGISFTRNLHTPIHKTTTHFSALGRKCPRFDWCHDEYEIRYPLDGSTGENAHTYIYTPYYTVPPRITERNEDRILDGGSISPHYWLLSTTSFDRSLQYSTYLFEFQDPSSNPPVLFVSPLLLTGDSVQIITQPLIASYNHPLLFFDIFLRFLLTCICVSFPNFLSPFPDSRYSLNDSVPNALSQFYRFSVLTATILPQVGLFISSSDSLTETRRTTSTIPTPCRPVSYYLALTIVSRCSVASIGRNQKAGYVYVSGYQLQGFD